MKNTFTKFFILIMIFLVAFPFGNVRATDMASLTDEEIYEMQTHNVFQQVLSEFFITIGDYAQNFLKKVFGEEITIDKIVFNRTESLNANFFDKGPNSSSNTVSATIKNVINQWFSYFRSIALVIILLTLVVAGINILIQSTNARLKALESVKRVIMAVVLLFFFPYVMRYAFEINEVIVKTIASETGRNEEDVLYPQVITPETDLKENELEFRSPKYVGSSVSKVSISSAEATKIYLNKSNEYIANADVMRLMRAYAGITLRFVFVVLWYIMLAQTYALTITYLRRYITLAFLIAAYPIVIIGYVIGGMFGRKDNAFNKWSKTFFTNVFLQTIHAVIYGVISGVVIFQVKQQINSSGSIQSVNVILLIIATSFLFSGEKIISKLWKASIDASERKGLRDIFKGPQRFIKNIRGK